jgi:hypothetical protein
LLLVVGFGGRVDNDRALNDLQKIELIESAL